jgi:hypothetical protein
MKLLLLHRTEYDLNRKVFGRKTAMTFSRISSRNSPEETELLSQLIFEPDYYTGLKGEGTEVSFTASYTLSRYGIAQ